MSDHHNCEIERVAIQDLGALVAFVAEAKLAGHDGACQLGLDFLSLGVALLRECHRLEITRAAALSLVATIQSYSPGHKLAAQAERALIQAKEVYH